MSFADSYDEAESCKDCSLQHCDFIAGAGSTAETISKKSSNFEPDNNSDVCFIVEGSVEQVGPG